MGPSDRWVVWPYPRWALFAAIGVMVLTNIATAAVAVHYDEASVPVAILWGAAPIISMLVTLWWHRRRGLGAFRPQAYRRPKALASR